MTQQSYSCAGNRRAIENACKTLDNPVEELMKLMTIAKQSEMPHMLRIEASWTLCNVAALVKDEDRCIEASQILIDDYKANVNAVFSVSEMTTGQVAIAKKKYKLASYLVSKGSKIRKPMFLMVEGRPRKIHRHGLYDKRLMQFEAFEKPLSQSEKTD